VMVPVISYTTSMYKASNYARVILDYSLQLTPSSLGKVTIILSPSTQLASDVQSKFSCSFKGSTNQEVTYPTLTEQASMKRAGDMGQSVSNILPSYTLAGSPEAFDITMITVATLDPSGILVRFCQILKIINKLYFININYGKRLDAFLSKIVASFKLKTTSSTELVYNQSNYRGKISSHKISLDVYEDYKILIFVYFGSWLLKLGFAVLSVLRPRVNKWVFLCLYVQPRVHLLIFNATFIDFLWLGSRTMLHARSLPIFSVIIAYTLFGLISLDIISTYHTVLHKLNHQLYFEAKDATTVLSKPKTGAPSSSASTSTISLPSVNISATYRLIESNYHMNRQAYADFIGQRGAASILSWIGYPLQVTRLAVYAVVTVPSQYASGLGICVLTAVEMFLLGQSIYCYIKYKYLKNIICLLIRITQSFFMLLYLTVCIAIHRKRFDEIIMDFYQDAGIWIVIASCVAEYLLLITYIAVAAYEFFKNRKSKPMGRSTMEKVFWFIRYFESVATTEILASRSVIRSPRSKPTIFRGVRTTSKIVEIPVKLDDSTPSPLRISRKVTYKKTLNNSKPSLTNFQPKSPLMTPLTSNRRTIKSNSILGNESIRKSAEINENAEKTPTKL
jgi:hypothetical protein